MPDLTCAAPNLLWHDKLILMDTLYIIGVMADQNGKLVAKLNSLNHFYVPKSHALLVMGTGL